MWRWLLRQGPLTAQRGRDHFLFVEPPHSFFLEKVCSITVCHTDACDLAALIDKGAARFRPAKGVQTKFKLKPGKQPRPVCEAPGQLLPAPATCFVAMPTGAACNASSRERIHQCVRARMQCGMFKFTADAYAAEEIRLLEELTSNMHLLLIDVGFEMTAGQRGGGWPRSWHYVPYKTNLHYVPVAARRAAAIATVPENAHDYTSYSVRIVCPCRPSLWRWCCAV